MAVFPSFKLTEKGEELLNISIGEGKTLTFTKFELGDGNTPSDFRKQTGLVNKFYEFPILNTSIQKDQVLRIRGYFDNKSFSQDKQLKEIGVFVKIEGNETQYLYSYTNAGDTGDIIPANSRGFYSRTLDVANYIGYATNITFNIEQLRDRYAFNTENEMKVASYLKAGDKVELWGNVALGDSSFKMYIITDQAQPIQLNNNLYAKEYFAIVNDLTTGGADNAGSAEMVKKLGEDKQNKTDNGLQTDSKEIVGAINESLWNIGYKTLGTVNDFNELTQSGVFFGRAEVGTLNSPYTQPFNFILINYNRSGLIEQTIITGVDDIVVRRQLGASWRNWEKTLRTNTKEFLGNAGISSIVYIQDSGTKTKDNGYIDKYTGKLYIAKETNTDVTVTSKFRLATNIENAKEPLSIDVYTKNSVSVNTELTIIPESELSNYSQFDEIEFIADSDGSGECSSYKITIGAVLKAYDTVSSNTQDESKGRIVFWMPDSANRIEIKKKLGVGIIVKNLYSNWYLANCRIIQHY